MNTLIFEGAGMDWKETGLNHRIRTRIKNKNGRIIYFEMTGSEQSKYNHNPFEFTGFVSHCFFADVPEDLKKNYSKEIVHIEHLKCEYTKKGIIEFINKNLDCDFDDLIISDDVYVHGTEEALC
jgi:hypothetical protein